MASSLGALWLRAMPSLSDGTTSAKVNKRQGGKNKLGPSADCRLNCKKWPPVYLNYCGNNGSSPTSKEANSSGGPMPLKVGTASTHCSPSLRSQARRFYTQRNTTSNARNLGGSFLGA